MTEQKPMATTAADAPADDLAAKVDELRKGADPLVFERCAAFHPHAATSQEAFDAFKADLARLASEAKADPAKPGEPVKT